jgi:hypothetical protein
MLLSTCLIQTLTAKRVRDALYSLDGPVLKELSAVADLLVKPHLHLQAMVICAHAAGLIQLEEDDLGEMVSWFGEVK